VRASSKAPPLPVTEHQCAVEIHRPMAEPLTGSRWVQIDRSSVGVLPKCATLTASAPGLSARLALFHPPGAFPPSVLSCGNDCAVQGSWHVEHLQPQRSIPDVLCIYRSRSGRHLDP